MKKITKKVAKGLPVGIRVRKPRYYYQDFADIYNISTTKNIDLVEFEGLDYERNYSNLTFKNKKLWNNKQYKGSTRALAPYIADTVYKISNVSVNGSVKIANNVFSGFSKDNYVYLDSSFKKYKSVNIVKFTTGSDVSTKQCVVHSEGFWVVEIQGGNIMCRGSDVFRNILPNTTYWIKTEINDRNNVITISTDGINYTNTYNSYWSNGYASVYPICFGISSYDYSNPFLGTIDFNGVSISTDEEIVLSNKPTSEYVISSQKYLTTKKGFDYKVVGNPENNGYVYEKFSASDYLSLPILKFGQGSWEFTIKATPRADDITNENAILNAEQDIKGVRIGTAGTVKGRWEFLVSSGSGWINTSSHYGSHVVQANTTYWLKAGFDAANSKYYLKYSTNGVDYIDDISYTSDTKAQETNHNIGRSINSIYWKGSIDITNASLVADGVEIWGKDVISVTELKGCLDEGLTDNSNETTYNAFVKDDEILLTDKENIEGMFWANKVIVPSHLKTGIYLKNYSQVGLLNIDLSYNVSGFGKGAVIYSPIIEANTSNETLCYIFKVKPGKVESTWRILMGNKGGLNHLLGVGDGKWFLWNVSTHASSGAHESNTPYWVAVMVYPDQTIVYYMKDDGTYNDVSKIPLPAIRGGTQSYWSTGPTMNTNLFMNTAKWIGAGNDNSDQYWTGSVDIKNTIVYKNHNNFMANTEVVWQPLLTVSEPDKLPDKEWM